MENNKEIVTLLKDIKYSIMIIFFMLFAIAIGIAYRCDKIFERMDKASLEVREEYNKNRKQLQLFLDENVVVVEKRNGKYTLVIQEEKENGGSQ